MKILVADDNKISRRMLDVALAKWGYNVTAVEDGAEAWKALQSSNAPEIAFLNWKLPQQDGIDICRKLREGETSGYTYIVLLAEETTPKEEILAAIVAGADQCIKKPIEWQDLEVMLKALSRLFANQVKLKERIASLEFMLKHKDLLSKQPKPEAAEQKPMGLSEKLLQLSQICNIDKIFGGIFEQMGVGSTSESTPEAFETAKDTDIVGWSVFILKQPGAWMDFEVEVARDSAIALFSELFGAPPDTDEQLCDAISEILNMFIGSLKAEFDGSGIDVLTPVVPKAFLRGKISGLVPRGGRSKEYCYAISQAKVRLVLSEFSSAAIEKPASQLNPLDVLVAPLLSPKNPAQALLPAGVILNANHVAKLKQLGQSTKNGLPLSVVSASPVTKMLFPL
ncbi:MAG: response regulator [Pseudomonadota bacterium]